MNWLRQSTAVDVMLGPFLDSVDGNTIESGLTITQPDIRLSKNGGAFAQKSAAQTLTHGENGWYAANLSTTDTGTLGSLVVAVHESGALPVWREFMVVPANVYDSFFSTDLLQVDLTQWLGVAPNALVSNRVEAIVGAMASNTLTAAATAADYLAEINTEVDTALVDARLDELLAADSDIDGAAPPTVGSVFHELMSKSTGSFTFDQTTDSLEAVRDKEADIETDTQDLQARLPASLAAGGRMVSSVEAYASGLEPLQPTVAGRTLDVTATGEAGIDWANIGAPTTVQGLSGTTIKTATDIETDTQDIQTRLPDALVSGHIKARVEAVAANAINDAGVAADMDNYSAKVWVIKDGTTADRYGVRWYKNLVPITSGITSPTIQVIKASDGTNLIAPTALTEIGSTHRFKRDETTDKMSAGQMYFAVVSATIDGSTRTAEQQVGRDAS